MSNDHLTPDLLAQVAATSGDDPEHVAGCPSCRADLDAFRRLAAELRTLPDPPASLTEAAKAYFRRRRRLEELIVRLAEDPALRARAVSDPAAVLREAELVVTPELIEALRESERASGDVARRLAARTLWF